MEPGLFVRVSTLFLCCMGRPRLLLIPLLRFSKFAEGFGWKKPHLEVLDELPSANIAAILELERFRPTRVANGHISRPGCLVLRGIVE